MQTLTAPTSFIVHDDLDAVVATMADARSAATQRAYQQALRSLLTHYGERGWDIYPQTGSRLDSDLFVKQLLLYFQHLIHEGRSYSTLNKLLAAVKAHAWEVEPHAHGLLWSESIRRFMSGAARQQKTRAVRKAKSFTVDDLRRLYSLARTDRSPRSIRDRALIAVGVAGALRSSSIADLTFGDVSKATLIDGIDLSLRFSKTDQTGEGAVIPIARAADAALCPVRHLDAWRTVMFTRGATDAAPLFPTIRGTHGVTENAIANPSLTLTEMLRSRVLHAGIASTEEAAAYSSHSLRATFITLSSQAGVNEASIAAVSGHKDMKTLRSYDRSSVERHAQAAYLDA